MKILVVDDEVLIREVIKEYSIYEGYEILEANDGIEAINIIERENIDLVILDIMMPRLDGFSTYKEIKKKKNIKTIMLSARNDEYDKLFAFELGADDYLTKPFSPKELIARIKAVSRRDKLEDKFDYDNLEVDFKGHTLKINNEEIKITPKEYEILVYLIENKNIAISREQILSNIWGYDFFGDDRTIDTHIKMLRNNLGEYRDLIVTVRGMGYKFEVNKDK